MPQPPLTHEERQKKAAAKINQIGLSRQACEAHRAKVAPKKAALEAEVKAKAKSPEDKAARAARIERGKASKAAVEKIAAEKKDGASA